jgi:hypothetical protein
LYKNKTIFALIFIIILIAPILLWVSYFSAKQVHYFTIQERLEIEKLQSITVNVTDINWVKKDKEIVIANHLFDVKKYTIKGKQAVLLGIFDNYEDEIKQQLNKLETANTNKALPIHTLLLNLLNPTILLQSSNTLHNTYTILSTQYMMLITKHYTSYFLKVPTPPPNNFLPYFS